MKFGFTKMNINEFKEYISKLKIARTILTIQQHHTYIPSYIHFTGNNHFELQRGMKNTHVNQNGWADIGQHFSIFPDGEILTGRSIEKSPACIYGNNANSICLENVGYFDIGYDEMNTGQKEAIVQITAALCDKFNLMPDTNKIIYHHWFNLSTGKRNNGSGNNKSCPGTNFFGGNKVDDCNNHFIPLIKNKINHSDESIIPKKYVYVKSNLLNIRMGSGANFNKIPNRNPALYGAILRVYNERNGWYKISSSADHWVSGKYTQEVKRAIVNTNDLNIRSGIGTQFPMVGKLMKGEEIFIYEESGNWVKVDIDEKWVNKKYITYLNNYK